MRRCRKRKKTAALTKIFIYSQPGLVITNISIFANFDHMGPWAPWAHGPMGPYGPGPIPERTKIPFRRFKIFLLENKKIFFLYKKKIFFLYKNKIFLL